MDCKEEAPHGGSGASWVPLGGTLMMGERSAPSRNATKSSRKVGGIFRCVLGCGLMRVITIELLAFNDIWRRGWDSNPRYGYPYNGFRDRLTQIGTGGRVNSRWLQVPDVDLFPHLARAVEPRSM